MDSKSAKTFYISTSIPYVNAIPHLGHAMEFVLADVLARYHKQMGDDVFFSIGTDEHGGKVMEKAIEMGISPRRYVDQISTSFRDLGELLTIDYTKFIRTTDENHEAIAAIIWQKLEPYIYKSSYEGMYDQKEESYVSKEEAKRIEQEDPEHFARLVSLKEENHFFKLSEFTEPIKLAIESDELKIIPSTRKNEILSLLNQGLDDISISRPKEKIPWGIDVPGDANQTMYVWFEALMNYITTLGYPDQTDFKTFWPADVHVIGKDIVRFHAAIWPAMLLGLGIELPKSIYVHGFINVDGEKMSKSVGNGVSPTEIVSAYNTDAFRFYVLRHIPSNSDGDFSWEKFERAYNSELANELGNLVQRTKSMIVRYQQGVIGEMQESMHDEGPFHEHIENFRFDLALDYLWTLIRGLNQYIEDEKPWQLAKENDLDHLRSCLQYVASSLVQIGDLLVPFMPNAGQTIKNTFEEGIIRGTDETLFPKIHNYTKPGTQAQ